MRRRHPRHFLIALVFGPVCVSCDSAHSDIPHTLDFLPQPHLARPNPLPSALVAEGHLELFDPLLCATAEEDRSYVYDYTWHKVYQLDSLLNPTWSFGRRGRSSLALGNPTDLRQFEDQIWIADPRNARIAILNDRGSLIRQLPLSRIVRLGPIASNSFWAVSLEPRPIRRYALSNGGAIETVETFEYIDARTREPIGPNVLSTVTPELWFLALLNSKGFLALEESGVPRYARRFVKHCLGDSRNCEQHLPLSISASGSYLYILSSHSVTDPKYLDIYHASDGVHLLTYALEGDARCISVDEETLLVTYKDPEPSIKLIQITDSLSYMIDDTGSHEERSSEPAW